jgi:tetratricopeptide (TPR) repeat protein
MSSTLLRAAAAGAALFVLASTCGCEQSPAPDAATRRDPEQAAAHVRRGNDLLKQHRVPEALAEYDEAIRLAPDNWEPWFNRGLVRDDVLEDWPRAIEDYTRVLELRPGHPWALNNRGNCYTDIGEHELSIADFTTLIELEPGEPDGYYNRGCAYHAAGAYRRAIRDFDTAIDMNPDDAAYWENRGLSYLHRERYEDAVDDYTKSIELDPSATAYFNRAFCHDELGQYAKAIADLDKVIELTPNDPEAYSNRGFAWQALGEKGRAAADFNRAKRLSSANR